MTVNFAAAGNQALNQLNNLPFDNIIGGPLNAAISAQAQAAETTVEFIQSVGMREVNGQKEAINVQFVYQDSGGTSRRITVPILAIVPIPFIVIDNVSIAFKAKITASAAAQSSQSKSQAGYVRGYVGYHGTRLRAGLSAGYSAKKDSKASQESKYSVEYTMDVQVNASQAGLPAGMEAVLGFLQQGTHEQPADVQLQMLGLAAISNLPAATAYTSSFNLVASDAANQPILNLTSPGMVDVSSANDFFALDASGVSDGNDLNDGVYQIPLIAGAGWPATVTAGDEFVDEISVTVTTATDVIVITRPITVRIV